MASRYPISSPQRTVAGNLSTLGSVSLANGGHSVEPQTPEYDVLRFQLTAACAHLGACPVEKMSVWKINNIDLQYKYERRSSGMLRLNGWINAESLSAENSLESISNRGFSFDSAKQRGMEFPTGTINKIPDYSLGTELCFVFFEVAVGRSFVCDKDISAAQIPPGYDSLYLSPKPFDRNKDGKFSLHEYQLAASFDHRPSRDYSHRYFISDMQQVCPKYIVRFKLLRVSDQFQAVDLLKSVSSASLPDVQLIDPITLQPSSQPLGATATSGFANTTTMNSSLQRGDLSPLGKLSGLDKRFLSVEKVYHQAIEELEFFDHDPAVISKNQWLQRQLGSIEEKVREINLNYVEVLEIIEEAARAAKAKLQKSVRDKLEMCLSMEIELRRQEEQMKWLQETMLEQVKKYQQAIVEAHGNDALRRKLMLQFLKLWKQHNLTTNGLSRLKPNELQTLSSIHGDVRVQTDIRLFTDPFYSSDKKQENQSDANNGVGQRTSLISGQNHLQELTSRAKATELFAPSVVPVGESLIPAPVQAVIDQEMETLQTLIANEATHGTFRLPASITRPLTGGNAPPLPLHAALGWLKKDSSSPENTTFAAAKVLESVTDADEALKLAFSASLPGALGYHHEEIHTPMEKKTEEEKVVSPLSDPGSTPGKQSVSKWEQEMPPTPPLPPPPNALSISPMSTVSKVILNIPRRKDQTTTSERNYPPSSVADYTVTSDDDIRMNIEQLRKLVAERQQYSLSELGARKLKQLQPRLEAGLDRMGYNALRGSHIVLPDEIEHLYYCLPFFSKPPTLKLLYSTHLHRSHIDEVFSRTIKNRNAVLLLIQSGEFRFGAYLSHAPVPTSQWSGSPSCFLFSLTLDIKIPFHARHVLGESSLQEPMALFAHGERIFIGNGDLSIDSKLSSGTTELENSYGLGLPEHSTAAMCVLAGQPVFTIDDLELWTIVA